MCCVVLCRAVALLLFRLADVSLFRSGFISGLLLFLFRESPHSFVCALPLAEFGGLRQLPLPETSRRLTRLFHTWFGYWPNPTCRSVGKMYTSRVLVLNLVPHTPFLYSYLLMLFSRDYGGRETVFENSKDPEMPASSRSVSRNSSISASVLTATAILP